MNSKRPLEDSLASNLSLIESFWNRCSFHDKVIESIDRVRGRVVITLADYILVLVNVIKYEAHVEEFPCVWLYHRVTISENAATLAIEVERGKIVAAFRNVRLFRRADMTVLVPAID